MIRITDAPLPTPDPWAADTAERCPYCAAPNPGDQRCRSCGKPLVVRTRRKRPLTATMANLLVLLVGRGPLLLIIALLYRLSDAPLLTPWTLLIAAITALLWLSAAGLLFRLPVAWYAALILALGDTIAAVGLQIAVPTHPVVPIALIASDLMVLGLLLLVFDEVRLETLRLALPEAANLPHSAMGAYEAGVAYSKAELWYFAARMWQRAVQFEHHEGRYRRALGLTYLRLKQYPAARSELQAAQTLMPDDAQTRELLRLAESSPANQQH
jgi:tetratricopeptide (TPR) repeat protein